ncbi:MAG: epoxyqueuosine reductase QueH [Lachnospiraceae bacterium]
MNHINYQNELEKIVTSMDKGATLCLHSCCAPCSSYVLEYLCQFFLITVFFFNPNISRKEEYKKRVEEQIKLIETFNEEKKGYPISFIEGDYNPQTFFAITKGLENCEEGGARCDFCFQLRLEETVKHALEMNADYFTTTLTISPMKDAKKLNQIGKQLEAVYNVKWLPSDFKKKNGYQRSIQLSKEYELYRQDYCGCIFSENRVLSDV